MQETISNLKTKIVTSDDGLRRYELTKIWDGSKPSLAIIMICPSSSGEVAVDTSTALTIGNAYRLGYGSVTILNLYSEINNFELKGVEDTDEENLQTIIAAAESVDQIILAWGTGKAKNKAFQTRMEQVAKALQPFEEKCRCLCDENGRGRGGHPLSPRLRRWCLCECSLSEFVDIPMEEIPVKKKGKSKPSSKQSAE